MAKDDKEIVSKVRLALIDRVGSDVFDLWFGTRVTWAWSGGKMRVFAPDLFTLDRLRNKLRTEVIAVCQSVTGSTHVEFLLAAGERPGPERRAETPASRTRSSPRGAMRSSSTSKAPVVPPASRGRGAGSARDAQSAGDSRKEPAASASSSSAARAAAARPVSTWSNFIVGDANRLAFTASQSVSAKPGAVSPLFLHGPSGCGKSLLVDCLLHEARRRHPHKRALLLSAEQFTSQFLEALHGSGLPSFRRKYRDVDVLVLDDIHFFAGKKATMVELQHTVDTLQRSGRQLVLTADRAPQELPGLGRELVNRLCGGLVCRIEPADEAIRLGILQQQTEKRGLRVPAAVLRMVAEQVNGDARVLSGALFRLQATSQALQKPITVELAQSALADLLRATRRIIRLPDIEQAVCQVFGLDSRSLQSDAKKRTVSEPRMLAMWLARKYTRSALSEIGEFFGRRSHTSVIAAQRKIDQLLTDDSAPRSVAAMSCSFSEAVRRVESQLRTGS